MTARAGRPRASGPSTCGRAALLPVRPPRRRGCLGALRVARGRPFGADRAGHRTSSTALSSRSSSGSADDSPDPLVIAIPRHGRSSRTGVGPATCHRRDVMPCPCRACCEPASRAGASVEGCADGYRDRVQPATDYSLVDAGGWRRLERFGAVMIDRPAPGAAEPARRPEAWSRADASFDHEGGWQWLEPRPSPWLAGIDGLTFELGSTNTGQIGLFPEQAPMWRWLADRTRPASSVLNLFGYTGGATLAAARAGATVVHVDASRPAVAWARRNAALSGLADRPVRWIVDDATSFVAREHRRGRRYDGLILDPPSYGHGDGGRAWRLESGPRAAPRCRRRAPRPCDPRLSC